MTRATVSADGETITVHIPMVFKKRGGRKLVLTPDGAEWAPRPRVDNAMVKALARAFQWREMVETGPFGTLEDLARAPGCPAPTTPVAPNRKTSQPARRRAWSAATITASVSRLALPPRAAKS